MGNPFSKYNIFKVIPCKLTSSFVCLATIKKKNEVWLMKVKVNTKTFKLGTLIFYSSLFPFFWLIFIEFLIPLFYFSFFSIIINF